MFTCLSRGVAPDEPRRYVGLKNQGATCHLNTVLQALFMTPEFRKGLLGLPPGDLPPTAKSVCTVFARMSQGGRTVSTKPLTSALKPVYVCTRQQDCHDTWLTLCDRLESDLKHTPLAKLVAELFEGKSADYVKCHACGTVTNMKDTFSNLSLDVPEGEGQQSRGHDDDEEDDDEDDDAGGVGVGGSPGAHTVLRGLREFLKPEQLRGDDQFMCDKCKCKCDAERGVRLRSMPPIVSVHLKRFAIHSSTDRKGRVELSLTKVNTEVTFPRTLDLRPFVTPEETAEASAPAADGRSRTPPQAAAAARTPPQAAAAAAEEPPPPLAGGATSAGEVEMTAVGVGGAQPTGGGADGEVGSSALTASARSASSLRYGLYAVLLHTGSLEKGHYFALIRDVADGAWYRFDDERVTPLTNDELERELTKAYMRMPAAPNPHLPPPPLPPH